MVDRLGIIPGQPRSVLNVASKCGPRAERGVRSPDAGSDELIHPSCVGREAGEDAGSADGEMCANDLKRPGVQRVQGLSPAELPESKLQEAREIQIVC